MTTTDTGRPPTLDGCPVPGLRYVANWIAPETAARLLSTIDGETWASPLRRRVQHYGHRYDYGSRNVDSEPAPALPVWAGDLATRLLDEGFTDNPTEQVIVNEYLPGQGISAHIDSVAQFGPVVAAISLGSRCVMDFGHLDSPAKVSVPLEPNSLCVMAGDARYRWRHAIAARKTDPGPSGRIPRQRRVSVTFRTLAAG